MINSFCVAAVGRTRRLAVTRPQAKIYTMSLARLSKKKLPTTGKSLKRNKIKDEDPKFFYQRQVVQKKLFIAFFFFSCLG